jgi:hypothetical protein
MTFRHRRAHRARIFRWCEEELFSPTIRVLRALHYGFWLGMLDLADHGWLAQRYCQGQPIYEDRDYNLTGFVPWEQAAIDAYFVRCQSVVVAAAGGGREVVALLRRGLAVEAFDCCPQLVQYCRDLLADLGHAAVVHDAEPDSVPEGLSIHDGAIVGWGAYTHVPGRDRRIRFLRGLRAVVNVGSPILLSFYAEKGDAHAPSWTYRIASVVRFLRRNGEPLEPGDGFSGSFEHHFTRAEIHSELADAGFDLCHYSPKEFGHAVGIAR